MVHILHGCVDNKRDVDPEDTRTQHHVDRVGHEMPVVQAPYLYPARDGGTHQQTRSNKYRRYASVTSPVFIPRPGRRQIPGPENDTEERSQGTGKGPQRTLNDNKHVRASGTEDRAAPNPPSRDRAARQKDQPETPGEEQKMRTTRGSTVQPGLRNRRTMTPFMPVPPSEEPVYTMASIPQATHIRTVPKPSLRTRGRKKANMSTSTVFREKAAAASSSKDHTAPNPLRRDRAAGQKAKPEPPGERQKMSTNRGSPMAPSGKNSRTVTPLMPVPSTEKQANTLASIPPATHIWTVSKGTSMTCTVNPSRRKGIQQPQVHQDEGCRCLANQRTTAPYFYPARDGGNNQPWREKTREPRISTPPGTAAATQHGDKTREPRTYIPPGTAANQHNQITQTAMAEQDHANTEVIDQVRKGAEEATVHHKGR